MNEHDSERISGMFELDGMSKAISEEYADVLFVNTCTIRENADDKLYGTLGQLKQWKSQKDNRKLLVGGCAAQKDKELVREKAPWVDVVIGTHNLTNVVDLLNRSEDWGPLTEIIDEIEDKFIGKKIISSQPKNELLFSESSDDEIIFEKKPKKHLVEINEDNTFKNIFNPLKKRRLSYDLNLSKIPEDIDSSVERSSPSPEIPFISSPISNKEMEFDNLEEEISLKLSNSKISVKSINLGEKEEDNWDLVTE